MKVFSATSERPRLVGELLVDLGGIYGIINYQATVYRWYIDAAINLGYAYGKKCMDGF